jgi:hypothetical protein
MTPFQRLSPGPTIPELMRAESRAWLRVNANVLAQCSQMRACFFAASFVLGVARVLLRLGLIEPRWAGTAFRIASKLNNAGVQAWHKSRRRDRVSNKN